jgi:hypothetical protein
MVATCMDSGFLSSENRQGAVKRAADAPHWEYESEAGGRLFTITP